METDSTECAPPRRWDWRRLIERGTLVRHPVSVARRRLGGALLVLMLLGFVRYALVTRDEAIRKRAVTFLQEATPGGVDVSVGRAAFKMFRGITLQDVRVSVPYDRRLDPQAVNARSRTIFSAESLTLIHNPWYLLLGKLRVERVVAIEPTIRLVHNADTGLRNWQLLWSGPLKATSPKPGIRPLVTLRSAKAVVVSVDRHGRHVSPEERLDADIRPHPQTTTGYDIEVRRYTKPIERTTMLFDPGQRLVANTPFVDARTVLLQLPAPAQALFNSIRLKGEVRLTRMLYDAASPSRRQTQIELRRVNCRFPFRLLDAATPSPTEARGELGASSQAAVTAPDAAEDQSLLHMTAVHGLLTLREKKLHIEVFGLVNGARCSLKGTLDRFEEGLADLGMNLTLHAEAVPTPEGPKRDRLLAAAEMPWVLRRIFEDYEPHGEFDLDLTFVRPPESQQPPRVTGTFRPRGAIGRCRWFPYRVDDLHGQVRVDGRQVFIENLRGRHGPADIRVDAGVDLRTHPAAVDLDITGSDVPLDAALFDALSAQYQAAWRHISPAGFTNIRAHLTRPPATKTHPSPAWKRSITVDLTDSRASPFASAKKGRAGPSSAPAYPLEHLHGRVQVEADHVRLIGVTGDYRGAKVVIDGDAALESSDLGKTTLSISVRGLRLDDSLAAVLPENRRETFRRLHATGLVDLSGTLSFGGSHIGLVPDLRVQVHDGDIRDEHLPYRVSHVQAELLIRPDGISIASASGTHGEARITADGLWRRVPAAAAQADGNTNRQQQGWVMDLNLAAERLALDAELHEALPQRLKRVWQRLNPSGQTQIRLRLHLASTAGHPSTRYRIELLPGDAAFRYRGFPLPISAARGRIIASPNRIEILSLAGEAGGGSIELAGQIDLRGPGMRGALTLNAEDLTFGDVLLAALPGGLGRFAATIKPTGRFSLRLDPLRFEIDAQGRTQWHFDGRLETSGAGADLGFALRQCDGTLAGRGTVNRQGKLALDLRAELQKATLAGWHLTDLQAHVTADPRAERVLVEDAHAGLYGGEVAGDAEVLLQGGRRRYQASITARDIQLSRYLQTHRKKATPKGKRPPHAARGSIAAKFALQGELGRHGYREGAGEVSISKAQVWKLPIVFAIFQVLNLTPDENVFHDGRLKFYLSQDTLTFQKIDLQGKALAFIGGGTLDLHTNQLDITLLAGSPLRIRVPLLSEILERASREIMEVRVTGTFDSPTIRPQPLKSLAAALETIFPEAPRVSHPRPISPADNE